MGAEDLHRAAASTLASQSAIHVCGTRHRKLLDLFYARRSSITSKHLRGITSGDIVESMVGTVIEMDRYYLRKSREYDEDEARIAEEQISGPAEGSTATAPAPEVIFWPDEIAA